MPSKKSIIFLVGPTASGKTDIAIVLANKTNAEIISCDSRQIYKDVSIGTAKPKISKQGYVSFENYKVKHHLFDIVNLKENFTVGDYVERFKETIKNIQARKKKILVVGGTGLYVKAITDGLSFIPNIDPEIRTKVNNMFKEKGIDYIRERLLEVDPKAYKVIDITNPRRITRALEVIMGSKVSIVDWQKNTKKPDINYKIIGLNLDRKVLYERINKRADKMIEQGLLEEVKDLINKDYTFDTINKAGIGYIHIANYLKGKISKEIAIELLKKETRNYAKRQMTWFKKTKGIHWINIKETDEPKTITRFLLDKI